MDEDLWVEILKRLPTESLCRFQSVCMRWNSIISSSFFINLHFTFNLSTTPRNLNPYLHYTYKRCALRHPLEEDDGKQLYFPFRPLYGGDHIRFAFVDVIHGVVCILYSQGQPFVASFHWAFLWNPSICKYIALPRITVNDDCFKSVGFGYDASTNDFKVVMISWRVYSNSMSFNVYSARQGLWRRSFKVDVDVEWMSYGCFLNGTIHWLIKKPHYSMMIFDCESEEVRTMGIPHQVSSSKSDLVLFEYAGMLAILVNPYHHSWSSMNLWVMVDHGVSTSWKNLADPFPCEIIINDSSFEIEKLVPYGPSDQWTKRSPMLYNHVYNKSMFLMDLPKAQSYTNGDIVDLLLPSTTLTSCDYITTKFGGPRPSKKKKERIRKTKRKYRV